MVEIPAGKFIMGNTQKQVEGFLIEGYESYGYFFQPGTFLDEVPRLSVYLDTFYIDRVEVTNRHYRQCIQAGFCPSVSLPRYHRASEITGYATESTYDEYPAYTSWVGARSYCQWVGKRLPTEAEWEKAARGTDGRQYPWGDEWDETRTELGPIPVGNYPQGASPYGVLGMVGNAPEWTRDPYALYPGIEQANPDLPFRWAEKLARDERAIRGDLGSRLKMRLTVRASGNPNSSVAGFRCVEGEEPVPLEKAVREILLPTPIPTLAPTPEPDLSDMIYIPAGEFIMGIDEARIEDNSDKISRRDETPAHVVYLDAYYIDRTEVTTKDYVTFMNALQESLDVPPGEFCDGESCASWGNSNANYIARRDGVFLVDDPQHAKYPITTVTWQGADAYCRWLGKRLPTEAEWEKAARGTDGRLYPWGDDRRSELIDFDRDREVGSIPENASPYGVLDMAGGVCEWVADRYAEDYYTLSPLANPTGPEWGGLRVERCGSPITFRRGIPEGGSYNLGFRCVYQPAP
jgi:formylglycine-generating enzyme required for sulfatase activity